jgi:extradiol dioxygenase family protein
MSEAEGREWRIFHLSLPVEDLAEAITFYTSTFEAVVGRRTPEWADIAVFGAQITLQDRPGDVTRPMPRTRHFGATLPWDEWEKVTARLCDFVEMPRKHHVGTLQEQAKAMVQDPSGNLIELKAYRHPTAVLGKLAEAASP